MTSPALLIKAQLTLTLTALSDFSIGNGQVLFEPLDNTNRQVCDHEGHPYLPAATLKGALRSRCHPSIVAALFGDTHSDDQGKVSRLSGCLNVYPGFLVGESDKVITTRNAIDEITGTAKANHLYSTEWIRQGAQFTAQIRAEMIEAHHLNCLLTQFAQGPLRLGSSTNNGYGRFDVVVSQCQVLSKAQLALWFAGEQPLRDYWLDYQSQTTPTQHSTTPTTEQGLSLELRLSSPDPMLIACPAQQTMVQDDINPPDSLFIRNQQGEPYIPATSLRGMLRAQYRRIARTLMGTKSDGEADIDRLCSLPWGNENQSSAIEIHDAQLNQPHNFRCHRQNFIAIDRLTGGVKDGAMLQVEAVTTNDYFVTSLILTNALFTTTAHTALALLLLTLRDLMSGELAIGAAKAKGYGRLHATIGFDHQQYHDFQALFGALCAVYDLDSAVLEQQLHRLTDEKGVVRDVTR